jgi:hypothetical protein
MQCDCKTRVEGELLDYLKEKHPDGTAHAVELQGYSITLGKEVGYRAGTDVATSFKREAKSTGRVSEKKGTLRMFFTYCPFCGTRAVPEEGEAPHA